MKKSPDLWIFQKHSNASQSLCDIIRLSREQMSMLQEKADADPLLATIESYVFSLYKQSITIIPKLSLYGHYYSRIQSLHDFRAIMGFEICIVWKGRLENVHIMSNVRLQGSHQHIMSNVRLQGSHQHIMSNVRLQVPINI